MKEDVTVTMFEAGEYTAERLSQPLVEFAAWIDEVLSKVPEEYRDDVQINFCLTNDDYTSPEISIYYVRPETDEEEAAREAEMQRRSSEAKMVREFSERAEYERLKAKFGG